MYRRLAPILLLAGACSKPSDPQVADPQLAEQVRRACELSECSDANSTVSVWRSGSGAVEVLVHEGSLDACSHPPMTYVGADGSIRLVQGNRPITGPEDAAALEVERAAVLADLVRDEKRHRCPPLPRE